MTVEGTTAPPVLLLNARDTAKALAICERKLWELTHNGQIPCIRIGRAVRYAPRDLQAWVDGQKQVRP